MTFNNMNYPIIAFLTVLAGFLLTAILVPLVKMLALRLNIVDNPQEADRKIHKAPIPLLGGTAIFVTVFLGVLALKIFGLANFYSIPDSYLYGFFIGSLLLMIGGFLDDKYTLKPWQQIIWPILAAGAVLISGIKIEYVTNAWGAAGSTIFIGGYLSMVITFLWLIGMMYTTKFLDGLDGLLAGISAIAAVTIFIASIYWDIGMSATGLIALLLAGACIGFLIFNWHPAKIFLGEGGSLFLGFALGVLSIISGSKIATTLLVMGIPALDVLWVIIHRLIKRESPFSHADRKHLHFRLLDMGFGQRGAVLFLYALAALFGSMAVLNRSFGKLIGMGLLVVVMVALLSPSFQRRG